MSYIACQPIQQFWLTNSYSLLSYDTINLIASLNCGRRSYSVSRDLWAGCQKQPNEIQTFHLPSHRTTFVVLRERLLVVGLFMETSPRLNVIARVEVCNIIISSFCGIPCSTLYTKIEKKQPRLFYCKILQLLHFYMIVLQWRCLECHYIFSHVAAYTWHGF